MTDTTAGTTEPPIPIGWRAATQLEAETRIFGSIIFFAPILLAAINNPKVLEPDLSENTGSYIFLWYFVARWIGNVIIRGFMLLFGTTPIIRFIGLQARVWNLDGPIDYILFGPRRMEGSPDHRVNLIFSGTPNPQRAATVSIIAALATLSVFVFWAYKLNFHHFLYAAFTGTSPF